MSVAIRGIYATPVSSRPDGQGDFFSGADWRNFCIRIFTPGVEMKGVELERPQQPTGGVKSIGSVSFKASNPGSEPAVVWLGMAEDARYQPRAIAPPLEGREWIVEAPPWIERVRLYTVDMTWGVDARDTLGRAGKKPWRVLVKIDEAGRDATCEGLEVPEEPPPPVNLATAERF